MLSVKFSIHSAVVIARIKASGSGLSAVAYTLNPELINAFFVTGPIATAFISFTLEEFLLSCVVTCSTVDGSLMFCKPQSFVL